MNSPPQPRSLPVPPSGWRIVIGILLAFVIGALTCTGFVVFTWPDVADLNENNPETTAFIERYRERRVDAGQPVTLQWTWVGYDDISPHLKRAVVAAEDISFFSHDGFAYDEIREAIREALAGERVRGASTITQQLVKNLWLSPSRNPFRKVKEAMLTRQLEERLAKRRILELYLNVAEFGPGIYGVEAAAQHYFGLRALDLSEHQAAQLAASLPRPSRWHPGTDSPGYQRYVSEIEDRMRRADFLWRRI